MNEWWDSRTLEGRLTFDFWVAGRLGFRLPAIHI
jgi:hypothetical protein